MTLFWLRGVEQETLEIEVPRGVDLLTIVVVRREVLVAHPFDGTEVVRVDLR